MENSYLKEMITKYCLEYRIDPIVYLTGSCLNLDELFKDVQIEKI